MDATKKQWIDQGRELVEHEKQTKIVARREIAIIVEAMDSQVIQLKLKVIKFKGAYIKILKRYKQILVIFEKGVYNLPNYMLDEVKYHKII